MKKQINKIMITLCGALLIGCNSGGGSILTPSITLSITPQTCSINSNSSVTTSLSGINTNDWYYYGSSLESNGTYTAKTSPQSASSNSASDTLTCSQISNKTGLYYVMANDITQNNTTSNPVSVLVTP